MVLPNSHVPKETCKIYYDDQVGRSIGLQCEIDGASTTRILGIYAPNTDTQNQLFMEALAQRVSEEKADIVLGDFNKVESAEDRNPPRSEEPRVLRALENLHNTWNYIDGWRETWPSKLGYSYHSSNEWLSSSRIDRIFVTPRVFRACSNWKIGDFLHWTDHRLVSVDYCPKRVLKMGKGQWYLNTSLLETEGV